MDLRENVGKEIRRKPDIMQHIGSEDLPQDFGIKLLSASRIERVQPLCEKVTTWIPKNFVGIPRVIPDASDKLNFNRRNSNDTANQGSD